jgi:hypothetical protein
MTQEQLRMQMLAGIITEGQYKEMLNEDKEITLTPKQKKAWEDEMIKRFNELTDNSDPEYPGVSEAVYDIPGAAKDTLANILLGRKPDEHWEDYFESKLEKKGIDVDEFESYADQLYDEFTRGATNNKDIKYIQSWVKAYFG